MTEDVSSRSEIRCVLAQALHSALLALEGGSPLRSTLVKRLLFDPVLTFITLAVMVPASILYCIFVIIAATINPETKAIQWAIKAFARSWLFFTATRLAVRGTADSSLQYVVVSNHASWLDIMADFAAAPFPIRFLSKAELFKVPFLGWAFRAIGIIKVERRGGAAARREMNAGVQVAAERGHSLMVYPEGSRTRTGQLQPFKRGAFAIAIDNQLPVLPITIHGSFEAWPKGFWVRGGRVIAEIGDPIPTEGLTREDLNGLVKQTYEAVAETKARLEAE